MTIKYLDSKRLSGSPISDIVHDTTTSSESSGSVSSLTHTMTVADNSNRVLIACVSSYGSAPTHTGVTWNGDAMTAVPNSESYQAGSNNRTQLYYIIAPDTGSHNIVASFSGSATCGIGGMSFYNVNQTTPVGAANTSSATSTATSSLALTPTVTGSWIIAMISSSSSLGSATGLTQSYTEGTNALLRGGRNESPTIGSANTVGWGTSNHSHSMSGCEILRSGDIKPTNVENNSILVEKDTANRYWFNEGDYKIHSFTTTGASTFQVTAGSGNVEYLVIGGGGGGANTGAGAGGYLTNTGYPVTSQSYSITVGSGGAGGSIDGDGSDGSLSSIVPATSGTSITLTGGAGGKRSGVDGGNSSGASGSGGGADSNLTHSGGTGGTYGNAGGASSATLGSPHASGGGGGSGAAAPQAPNNSTGGTGGAGLSSSITGTAVVRAGGGGGSTYAVGGTGGTGGTGVGGAGSSGSGTSIAGTVNTGSGGGGAGASAPTSGAGGSGIVIIKYLNNGSITATGGTVSTTPIQPDTITKDNQAIIQHGTAGYGSPTTFSSFTVGNNSNRVLIVATGAYNASPDIVSVKFNGTEYFTRITGSNYASAYKVELWYLINPTVTTADVVIEWGTQAGQGGAGAGQMGAIVYSFYNVAQTSPIGTPVIGVDSVTTTPSTPITPTTAGSMIIDSWYNGAGTTVTNDLTDGMAIICGGVDRNMASQYDLTPTIGSVNNMSRVSGSDHFTQVAVEVKATTSPLATWTMEPTFEDDFSTDKGWTNLTSDTSVTTKLNYTEASSTYIRAAKDLQNSNALGSGNNMSDNFVIRFELNKTNDATNTSNGTQPLISISNATTDGWFNDEDCIGMIINQDTNQTHSIRSVGADNEKTHEGDSADAPYVWTTGIRYGEIIKNSSTDTVVATLYSNSDFTGVVVTASVSTTGKTYSGLRYLSMRNFADSSRASTVWEMNNVQVYDGVTSIN